MQLSELLTVSLAVVLALPALLVARLPLTEQPILGLPLPEAPILSLVTPRRRPRAIGATGDMAPGSC